MDMDERLEMHKEAVTRYLEEDLTRNQEEYDNAEKEREELEAIIDINDRESNVLYQRNAERIEKANGVIANTKKAAKYSLEQVIKILKEKNEEIAENYMSKKPGEIQLEINRLKTENQGLESDILHKEQVILETQELISKYSEIGDIERRTELENKLQSLKEDVSKKKEKLSINFNKLDKCLNYEKEYMENTKLIKEYREKAKTFGIELEEIKPEETKSEETGTKAPKAGAKKPETTAKTPKTGTKTPEAGVKAPEAGAKAPEAGAKTPKTGTKTPEAGAKAPEAGAKTPKTGTKTPEAGVKAPEAGAKAPEAGAKAPEAGVKAPEAGAEVPENEAMQRRYEKLLSDFQNVRNLSLEELIAAGINFSELAGHAFRLENGRSGYFTGVNKENIYSFEDFDGKKVTINLEKYIKGITEKIDKGEKDLLGTKKSYLTFLENWLKVADMNFDSEYDSLISKKLDREQIKNLLEKLREGLSKEEKVVPGTSEKGSPSTPGKGSSSTPGKGSPSTPEKGSPSTPEKGSPSTPEKGSPSTPGKGSPSTPGKGSPSTPEKGTPSTPGTKPKDIPVSKDSIKILLDASTGLARIDRRISGADTSFAFDLENLASSETEKKVRKTFVEKFKEAGDKKYARKIRTLRRKINPAVLGLIEGYDDGLDIIRQYIDAVEEGNKDKLPFDKYDIKLDGGIIYTADKVFTKLNRYAVRDNKNLGTDFKAIPMYTLKKNLIKFLPKGLPFVKKAMEALPASLEESEAKGKRKESIVQMDLEHRDLMVQLEVANNELRQAKKELEGAKTEVEKKQAEEEVRKARRKVQETRDKMLKSDRGASKTSSAHREFARQYRAQSPVVPAKSESSAEKVSGKDDDFDVEFNSYDDRY